MSKGRKRLTVPLQPPRLASGRLLASGFSGVFACHPVQRSVPVAVPAVDIRRRLQSCADGCQAVLYVTKQHCMDQVGQQHADPQTAGPSQCVHCAGSVGGG